LFSLTDPDAISSLPWPHFFRAAPLWGETVMKTSFHRAVMLMAASFGALAAPAPAVAQEMDPCVECHYNCRQAYVVNSNQPDTYLLCTNWCHRTYCDDYSALGPQLLATRRDCA